MTKQNMKSVTQMKELKNIVLKQYSVQSGIINRAFEINKNLCGKKYLMSPKRRHCFQERHMKACTYCKGSKKERLFLLMKIALTCFVSAISLI